MRNEAKTLIRPDLFRSTGFLALPKAAQELGHRALHSIEWGACARLKSVDYGLIEGMVGECITLAGKKVEAGTWMLVLYGRIIEHYEALNERWPHPVLRHEGSVYTRSVYGRLFGSVAVWRIEMAIRAIEGSNSMLAMNELAIAGTALYFGGTGEGQDGTRLDHAEQRRKGASVRWAGDPTQLMKQEMRREWKCWQLDRALYKLPRDFRKAMLNRFPDAVDGTLKNWMGDWEKEVNSHRGSKMSSC